MREVRFCLQYHLIQGGRKHLVPTVWLVDSPQVRAQIEALVENARVMTANATWWVEARGDDELRDEGMP